MEQAIDFVVTWVDGADEAWCREKAKYLQQDMNDDSEERYRDWGMLKYWFRGVEQFAPWVRKVHFITCGHLPAWLDTENPKLHIVKHEEYIPKEFLPTFNSNVIEMYMHRIEGLSEQFVYFNDDMLPINRMQPTDFFRNGKPCDMLAFQPVVANPKNPVMSHLYLNNILTLSKYFDKRENVRKQPLNYFHPGYPFMYFIYNVLEMAFPLYSGLYTVHGPSPFLKSTFEEVWEKEKEALAKMSSNRFRSENDLTQYLLREWQKLKGEFSAKNLHRDFKYFNIGEKDDKLIQAVKKQKSKLICVNDAEIAGDFEKIRAEIQAAFEQIMPIASSFEK